VCVLHDINTKARVRFNGRLCISVVVAEGRQLTAAVSGCAPIVCRQVTSGWLLCEIVSKVVFGQEILLVGMSETVTECCA
jgi:hypothetical protein